MDERILSSVGDSEGLRRTPRAAERILGQRIVAEPRGLGLAPELEAEDKALKVDFGVDASATVRCGETLKLSKIEKGRNPYLQYNMDIAPAPLDLPEALL